MALKSLVALGWQGVAKYIQALEPTLCKLTGTQTLTGKTLTAPVITSPVITEGVAAKTFSAGHADLTLAAADYNCGIITFASADQAANAIFPATAGKVWLVYNGSGQAITCKAAGQTGIAVANTKTAILRANGTDIVRVTADC